MGLITDICYPIWSRVFIEVCFCNSLEVGTFSEFVFASAEYPGISQNSVCKISVEYR
jgi:hypothetical protein